VLCYLKKLPPRILNPLAAICLAAIVLLLTLTLPSNLRRIGLKVSPDDLAASPLVNKILATRELTPLDPSVALEILHLSDPEKRTLANHLLWHLRDSSDSRRSAACQAIYFLKELAAPAVPSLTRLILQDNSLAVRMHAGSALGSIGRPASEAVPLLTKAAADLNNPYRAEAVYALECLGGVARSAGDELLSLAESNDAHLRAYAVSALSSTSNERSAAAILRGLRDPDSRVRKSAAVAARHLKAYPPELLPLLIDVLRDRNPELRQAAAFALGSMGNSAATATPALIEALQNQDQGMAAELAKSSAEGALRDIGTGARAAVPTLLKNLHDPSVTVRTGAISALGKIGENTPQVLEALCKQFDDSSYLIRGQALYALALLDFHSDKTQELLRQGLQDSHPSVREMAALLSRARQVKKPI
jgi:HEAT repeat protein